jgi:hypothetical protein
MRLMSGYLTLMRQAHRLHRQLCTWALCDQKRTTVVIEIACYHPRLRREVDADAPEMLGPIVGDRPLMDPLEWKPELSQMPPGLPGRRRWPRHRLRDAAGTLRWVHGGEQLTCGMKMLDISSGGAAVLADGESARAAPVWIRLDSGAAGPDPLVALVVSTSSQLPGKFIVRARFTSEIALESVLEQHEKPQLWQRYRARETRALLAWIDVGIEHVAPGRLVNISGGGAAVITEALLPDERPVQLTLAAGSAAITPVESRLVAISIDTSGSRVARLEFVEPCPLDLFELAVYGAPSQP